MTSKTAKQDDQKLFAFLAVFLSIIGFIIALIIRRDDKYIMFYARQSLVIFLSWVITGVIMVIPLFGWIIGPVINLGIFILWIITIINTFSGKQKDTWLIGELAKKINL